MPPVRLYHNLIRYQNQVVPTDYVIRGTAKKGSHMFSMDRLHYYYVDDVTIGGTDYYKYNFHGIEFYKLNDSRYSYEYGGTTYYFEFYDSGYDDFGNDCYFFIDENENQVTAYYIATHADDDGYYIFDNQGNKKHIIDYFPSSQIDEDFADNYAIYSEIDDKIFLLQTHDYFYYLNNNNLVPIQDLETYISLQNIEGLLTFDVTYISDTQIDENWYQSQDYPGMYEYYTSENIEFVSDGDSWSLSYPKTMKIKSFSAVISQPDEYGYEIPDQITSISFKDADDFYYMVSTDSMLADCDIQSADFRNTTFPNLTNATYMFDNCDSLTTILWANGTTFENLVNASHMFDYSIELDIQTMTMLCNAKQNYSLTTDLNNIILCFQSDGVHYHVLNNNDVEVYQLYSSISSNDVKYKYTGNISLNSTVTYGKTFNLTTIGDHAFSFSDQLTSVTIPVSVTTIEELAFNGCSNLSSINIGNLSLTTISDGCFDGCTSLQHITIPNTVTTIGDDAFKNSGLNEAVIPNSVISIGYDSFANCENIEYVTLGNSVTTINGYAFYNCTNSNFTSIIIPSTVTSIGSGAFSDCPFTSVDIQTTADIGYTYTGLSVLISYIDYYFLTKQTVAVKSVDGSHFSGAFTVPSSITTNSKTYNVTGISKGAFVNCENITSVTIPNTVVMYGQLGTDGMFKNCSDLTSITSMNLSSTSMIYYKNLFISMFEGCESLTTLPFTGSTERYIYVDSLRNMMKGCTSLQSIDVNLGSFLHTDQSSWDISPCDMTSMLEGCESLTSFAFESANRLIIENLNYVCKNCHSVVTVKFTKCSNMFDYANDPIPIEAISAFENCYDMTTLTLSAGSSTYETHIADATNMFKNCTSLTTLNLTNYYFDHDVSFEYSPLSMSSVESLCKYHLKKYEVLDVDSPTIKFNSSSYTSSEKNNIRDWCFNNNDSPKWNVTFV